jgi:hypothetical protein
MEQRRKKVSFGDFVEIESTSELSFDEQRQTWYSDDDYNVFKSKSRIIIRQARNTGLSHMLTGTCIEIGCSEAYKLKAQQLLKRWCRNGHIGRGLERGIHETMGKIRNKETIQYVQTVLKTQTLIGGCLDKHYRANELASVAMACSVRSREFALLMGRADAYAAAERAVRTLKQDDYSFRDEYSFRSELNSDRMLSDSPSSCKAVLMEQQPRVCTSRMA